MDKSAGEIAAGWSAAKANSLDDRATLAEYSSYLVAWDKYPCSTAFQTIFLCFSLAPLRRIAGFALFSHSSKNAGAHAAVSGHVLLGRAWLMEQ